MDAWKVMLKDKKILLVGAVQSLFEGAMYIFVLQAPILESQFFIFILLFALQAPILKLQSTSVPKVWCRTCQVP